MSLTVQQRAAWCLMVLDAASDADLADLRLTAVGDDSFVLTGRVRQPLWRRLLASRAQEAECQLRHALGAQYKVSGLSCRLTVRLR